jgi:ankyrin repeat protein
MIYHEITYFEEMWQNINHEIEQNEKDSLLVLATFCRLPEFAQFLVRNGADPNYSDVHGYKAIRYAAEQNRPIINLFRCLLDAGSEVNGPILSQGYLLLSPGM